MGWKESSSSISHLQQRPTEPMVQESEEESGVTVTTTESLRGLVVGNYCHDVLHRDDSIIGRGLGGASSFISNVLESLSLSNSSYRYISKVGNDFAYSHAVRHSPLVVPTSPTTLFHAHLDIGGRRTLRRVSACDPILPSELPFSSAPFECGIVAAVGGEISPQTLAGMLDLCRVVLVDAQGLIRTFGEDDGAVGLVPLRDTDFFGMLPRIGFLKASAEEAPFLDVDRARKACCVIVTDGEEGCRVYWKEGEVQVSAFPAVEIDPTGAGDSFLGGFLVGLSSGLTVPDAALLGNFFGSLTVGQIGIPKFDHRMLQNVKKELERKATQQKGPCWRNVAVNFQKSDTHEEFRAFLSEAAKYQNCYSTDLSNGHHNIGQ